MPQTIGLVVAALSVTSITSVPAAFAWTPVKVWNCPVRAFARVSAEGP